MGKYLFKSLLSLLWGIYPEDELLARTHHHFKWLQDVPLYGWATSSFSQFPIGRQLPLFINIRIINILVNISSSHCELFKTDLSISLPWLKTPRASPNSQTWLHFVAQGMRPLHSGPSCHCSPSLPNYSLMQCSRTFCTLSARHFFPLPVFVHDPSFPWDIWPPLSPLEFESLPKISPWLYLPLWTSCSPSQAELRQSSLYSWSSLPMSVRAFIMC